MKVPRHIVAQTIAERTLNVTDANVLAREIAAYLLAERRSGDLESIIRDIMQYRADHGALEAELVSAHEVDGLIISDVKQLLHEAYPAAKSIHVSPRTDENVIGGIRIDMANEQLDMTIAAKLATLKRYTAVDKG